MSRSKLINVYYKLLLSLICEPRRASEAAFSPNRRKPTGVQAPSDSVHFAATPDYGLCRQAYSKNRSFMAF